jgi:N-acetylglucosamine-6-phosphate deacetylase
MLAFTHATLLTQAQTVPDSTVVVDEQTGRILAAGQNLFIPDHAHQINLTGRYLAPGFIDLQLNGAFGLDFTVDPHTIPAVAEKLPRYGVTAFLPTIITSPPETVATAQDVWRNFSGENCAKPLGLHVEGPFFNPAKKGAHNPAYLRLPSPAAVETWTAASGVKLVTLAPELPGALETITALVEQGVVVSAGHSMATLAEAEAGFTAGVTYGTHLFNAMPPLHHREPGLAMALLNSPAVVGVIADGIHFHPALAQMVWQMKQTQVNLVTDAMAALGMPPGRYQLGSQEVEVTDTQATLADGTLAGSVLALDQALRNWVTWTNCTPAEAVATVTSTPAALLGLAHQIGHIAAGYPADLVVLSPDLQVEKTFINGQLVYQKG